MKSAHRHQLETNVLADWLGTKMQELEPYKNFIAIGFAVVLGLLLVAVFSFTGDNPAAAQQWSAYYSAFAQQDPVPALESLVDAKDGATTPAKLWGKIALADQQLATGCQLLFGNRKDALEKLEKAEGLYTQVVEGSSDPLLKNSARIGLGRTLESMDRGDAARKVFEEVIAADKESALAKLAQESLARLDNPRVVSTMTWITKQKPVLPAGHPPLGGLPGLNAPLPDRPDLSFPSSPLNTDGTAKPEVQPEAPTPDPEAKPEGEPKSDEAPKTEPAAESPAEPAVPATTTEPAATPDPVPPATTEPATTEPGAAPSTSEQPAATPDK